MPSSKYSVQAYSSACLGTEDTCQTVSPPVEMYTRRSGDVEAVYRPPGTTTQPDSIDIAQVINHFTGQPGAPVKCRVQLQPNMPEIKADVNALDIAAVVDAVKGLPYAQGGPCPCPSLMPCRQTSCTGAATCTALPAINGGGPGAMCVKTCSGGSKADGPCINNSHCPGGTCSATGFCRDKCGRCNKP
jgi:hypothetical protein